MRYLCDKRNSLARPIITSHRDGLSFNDNIQSCSIGPASFCIVEIEDGIEPNGLLCSTDQNHYNLCYVIFVRHGLIDISQLSGTIRLSPGQCILLNDCEVKFLRLTARCGLRVVVFPKRWLALRVAGVEEAVSRVIDTTQGWPIPLGHILDRIAIDSTGSASTPETELAEYIASALALAICETTPVMGAAYSTTYRRLQRVMRAELNDPHLNPGTFARRQGMSVRTLHAIFAAAGTSFGRTLLNMRLERSRILLEDPRHDALSVAEIAFLVGFTNASHFGRRFRECYNHSPAAWRSLRWDRTGTDSGGP